MKKKLPTKPKLTKPKGKSPLPKKPVKPQLRKPLKPKILVDKKKPTIDFHHNTTVLTQNSDVDTTSMALTPPPHEKSTPVSHAS